MSDFIEVGATDGGKVVGYRMPLGKNLYEITFKDGGEVPPELGGGWNDIRQMTNAIKGYLKNKPKTRAKGKK